MPKLKSMLIKYSYLKINYMYNDSCCTTHMITTVTFNIRTRQTKPQLSPRQNYCESKYVILH